MTHDAEIIRAMDVICRALNDESLEVAWLTEGMPDEAGEDDYESVAETSDDVEITTAVFMDVMRSAAEQERPLCFDVFQTRAR